MNFPRVLGELRRSPFSEEKLRTRRVKDELRDNLIARLRTSKDKDKDSEENTPKPAEN